ncbi:MAG: ATP-binding cassette, subfamily bacterial IrtB/YbtQ [Oceanotoga sp.]|uniref:ABC transporter ATP-binding protein n=1 Tax=Oceanotoga sp. TaxID=2108366 RepID=UPI002651F820|nr:ABC transporter ATP-binding protein [Oceanotoga sp.]MDN5341919.1 ATP-binding cassette, subfamily bacterial IrtB/YbtQ [Oceanotoga sp.]
MLKNYFALSDKGYKNLKQSIFIGVIYNISLMLPVGLLIYLLNSFITPFINDTEKSSMNFWIFSGIALLLFILLYIIEKIKYRLSYISAYEESANTRINLAEKIRTLPLSYFGKKNISDLTMTLMEDVTTLEHVLSHTAGEMVSAMISIVIIGVSLMFFNWKMAVALLAFVPIAVIMILVTKNIQHKNNKMVSKSKLKIYDSIQEILDNIKVIKGSNLEDIYYDKLKGKLDDSIKKALKVEFSTGSIIMSAQSILRLGFVTVIIAGIYFIMNGQIDLMTFLIFMVIASRIFDPLSSVFMMLAEVIHSRSCVERMLEIENYEIQKGSKSVNLSSYDINLEDVYFSYEKESVIKGINLEIKQGEVTALVGPSGCGKSTISKLIARFWDVNEGSIKIGGVDINTIDPEELLKNFSIVFQDVVLFNDTIYNNIKVGNMNASKQEIERVAKLARCDEFINKLSNGYETVIGENGYTLSGGERQRISIARALLKDAPIILLDEATASIDPENETLIQDAIGKLIKGKTVLIIAHRLRTIENVDKIVVINNGKVVEQGTNDELLELKGMYSKMLSLQKESAEWEIKQ